MPRQYGRTFAQHMEDMEPHIVVPFNIGITAQYRGHRAKWHCVASLLMSSSSMNNKPTKELNEATRASVVKEMAKPRITRSAKIAEMNLDPVRIPERPSTTMPGIVDKVIASPDAGQPGKAQITVDGADQGHRVLRIENELTDEHGDDVRLKKGAHVEVTVSSEPTQRGTT